MIGEAWKRIQETLEGPPIEDWVVSVIVFDQIRLPDGHQIQAVRISRDLQTGAVQLTQVVDCLVIVPCPHRELLERRQIVRLPLIQKDKNSSTQRGLRLFLVEKTHHAQIRLAVLEMKHEIGLHLDHSHRKGAQVIKIN